MKPLAFEEKKFVQIRTLCQRWDCSANYIRRLISIGLLKMWHPEGTLQTKGLKIEVTSILEVEKNGYID